jgi:2-polyprenyl-3-methyl-5-hydroxy-6-metoxy-1,4-benzoquinol methylase
VAGDVTGAGAGGPGGDPGSDPVLVYGPAPDASPSGSRSDGGPEGEAPPDGGGGPDPGPRRRLDARDLYTPAFDAALAAAEALVVLDPLSFPWEGYGRELDDLVIYLVLPGDLAPADLPTIFASAFDRLTFFDRVVATAPGALHALGRLRLAGCQKVLLRDGPDPETWARDDYLTRNAEVGTACQTISAREAARYWSERGAALGARQPDKSVCSVRHSVAENKVMHVEQMRALRPAIAALRPDREWSVVEFGCGTGRVLHEFHRLGARLFGVDVSRRLLATCRRNLPEATLRQGRVGLVEGFPPAPCDVAVFCTVFHHLGAAEKPAALRRAADALRPGGHLLMLEDHVAATEGEAAITRPVGVAELHAMLSEASGGAMVLEWFETVLYSHVPEVRTGLAVFRKAGG